MKNNILDFVSFRKIDESFSSNKKMVNDYMKAQRELLYPKGEYAEYGGIALYDLKKAKKTDGYWYEQRLELTAKRKQYKALSKAYKYFAENFYRNQYNARVRVGSGYKEEDIYDIDKFISEINSFYSNAENGFNGENYNNYVMVAIDTGARGLYAKSTNYKLVLKEDFKG
jgi:hypothetical protein